MIIKTRGGSVFYTTLEHRWLVVSEEGQEFNHFRKAKNLIVGQTIIHPNGERYVIADLGDDKNLEVI